MTGKKNILYKILFVLNYLIPLKKIRRHYKMFLKYLFYIPTQKDFIDIKMLTNEESIDYIIKNKCSFCRYGDGEIGYLLFDNFYHFFQPQNPELQNKLKSILSNPSPSCLIGIPYWMRAKAKSAFHKTCQIEYFTKFKKHLLSDYVYGSSFAFTLQSVGKNIQAIKKIWEDRQILIVTGKNSSFIYDDRIFGSAKSVSFLYTKAVDAYSEYENILSQIITHNKDTLILISLGLTATCLAYDLSNLGFQAIDIGQITNYYLNFLGEMENIEKLRSDKRFIDGVTDCATLKKDKK